MKKIIVLWSCLCILHLNLFANTNEAETQLDVDKYLGMLKNYSVQGKNILIEQTLLNGINALVDNTKIKINRFDIDDNTNKIFIDMFLKGEDKNLEVNISKFQWGVTPDKKYIIFEDFDIGMNIPWLQYIVDDIAKRENGYIKVPHNVALFSLLYTIKPNIKTTYKPFKKEPFIITDYPFDKRFLKINQLELSKKMIVTDIWLKGSKNNLKIDVDSYNLTTANGKKTIVLKDVKFKEFTKPWIKSLIENQKNEIHFNYTDKLYELLKR